MNKPITYGHLWNLFKVLLPLTAIFFSLIFLYNDRYKQGFNRGYEQANSEKMTYAESYKNDSNKSYSVTTPPCPTYYASIGSLCFVDFRIDPLSTTTYNL